MIASKKSVEEAETRCVEAMVEILGHIQTLQERIVNFEERLANITTAVAAHNSVLETLVKEKVADTEIQT